YHLGCSIPPKPQLRRKIALSNRSGQSRPALRSFQSSGAAFREEIFQSDSGIIAALHARREKLPHGGRWLHGWTPSFGGDGGSTERISLASWFQSTCASSGY